MGCCSKWCQLPELQAAVQVCALPAARQIAYSKGRGDLRRVCSGNKPKKSVQKGGSRKKGRSSGRSLKRLISLLLKIAGRKIWILVLVAVARTALSNRLARLQVGWLMYAGCMDSL